MANSRVAPELHCDGKLDLACRRQSCCSARTITICMFWCAVTVQDFLNRYEIGATVGVGGDIHATVYPLHANSVRIAHIA